MSSWNEGGLGLDGFKLIKSFHLSALLPLGAKSCKFLVQGVIVNATALKDESRQWEASKLTHVSGKHRFASGLVGLDLRTRAGTSIRLRSQIGRRSSY